jgi:hypothetical protein
METIPSACSSIQLGLFGSRPVSKRTSGAFTYGNDAAPDEYVVEDLVVDWCRDPSVAKHFPGAADALEDRLDQG